MLKLIQKQLDTHLTKISLIFSLIYFLLFNSAVVLHKFDYYKVTAFKAFLELSKDFIYIYIALFIIFFGLTIHRIVFITGALFLFFTGALASYYLYFFHIIPTKEIIKSFFSTESHEAYELISTKLIVWLVVSIFVCIYTIKHFGVNNTKLFVTKLLSAACLLVTTINIISPKYKILNNYFPTSYLHNTYLHFSEGFYPVVRNDISQQFNFTDNSSEDIIGVLVIGESARFDHFGINGYERDTTPNLSKMSDIYSFKAQACSNHTYLSVPCMLSRHPSTKIEEVMKETSLVSILTKLSFNTSWISTQSLMKYLNNTNLGTIYDEARLAIIPGGSLLLQMNDLDAKMLPYIENILNKKGKQFLVVHTSGSHWNYAARYPKEFEQFKPGCTVAYGKADQSSCTRECLANSYDNSILYTDFFLSSLIKLLKDKDAFLLYASDHAESLGEKGRYGHGGELTPEQTTIPFIIWMSPRFKAMNPSAIHSITSYVEKELSHNNIFHTILDCIGIESDIIDKGLSLCRVNPSRVQNEK